MSQEPDSPPPPESQPDPPSPQATVRLPPEEPQPPDSPPPQRGCWQRMGRLFSTLLFALFVVLVTVAAVSALAFFGFGYQPDTPRQVAGTSQELENLRQYNDELQGQVGTLQTSVAELELRASTNSEEVDELNRQIGEMVTLSEQLQENVSIAATTQAETRDSQLAIFTFATVQAERDTQIDELMRRTDRIVRFLQRLSDITADTTLDLDATPTPGDLPPPTEVPTITPTPTRTSPPTALPTVTPTDISPTPTEDATAEANGEDEEETTPTPTEDATAEADEDEEGTPTPTPDNESDL